MMTGAEQVLSADEEGKCEEGKCEEGKCEEGKCEEGKCKTEGNVIGGIVKTTGKCKQKGLFFSPRAWYKKKKLYSSCPFTFG